MNRSPFVDVSAKDGTPNGRRIDNLGPEDELDWTQRSDGMKRELKMGDLSNPFDAASSLQSDLLIEFDPFVSSSPATTSLPQPDLLMPMTPARNEIRRNLSAPYMSPLWTRKPAATSVTKMTTHMKTQEFVLGQAKTIVKIKEGASEAELKDYFAKLRRDHGHLLKYRLFLQVLRRGFDSSVALLDRFDESMKCEAVEELMEGSDGNGLISQHQNYMDSLQYDSPVGSMSVALPDFSALFGAFERSFLAIDEENEIEIHGGRFGMKKFAQKNDVSVKTHIQKTIRADDVQWKQPDLQELPDWWIANVAFASFGRLMKSEIKRCFPQVVPFGRLTEWKLKDIEAAAIQIENSSTYKWKSEVEAQLEFEDETVADVSAITNSNYESLCPVQSHRQPAFKTTTLGRGNFRGLTESQKKVAIDKMKAAHAAVESGKLQIVPALNKVIYQNEKGNVAVCIKLPNSDPGLKTCEVNGICRMGHYANQCHMNGKVNISRSNTQRVQSTIDSKVNALVDLAGIITGWGDSDMDPEEKKKLDDVAAKLGVGK